MLRKRLYLAKVEKLVRNSWVDGFAMIEVALAIAISGIVARFLLSGILFFKNLQQESKTETNSEIVFRALAGYVIRYGCLPYPSMPGRNGEEFEHPEDENEWEARGQEIMRGIVPYKTLGLQEKYAKDGYGYYFTYLVNPTLCARKSVISVPPNDIREYLDYSITKLENFGFIVSQQNPRTLVSYSGEINELGCLEYNPQKYSSYRAVRGFLKAYSAETALDEKTETKTWDIAFRISQIQIHCLYQDKEIECNQAYYLAPHLIRGVSAMDAEKQAQYQILLQAIRLDGNFPSSVFNNDQLKNNNLDRYKVMDCIAIVLISHGKTHIGAFTKTGGIVPIRGEVCEKKKQNSNLTDRKNYCHLDAQGDTVYWQSRFGLLSLYTKHNFEPGKIMII